MCFWCMHFHCLFVPIVLVASAQSKGFTLSASKNSSQSIKTASLVTVKSIIDAFDSSKTAEVFSLNCTCEASLVSPYETVQGHVIVPISNYHGLIKLNCCTDYKHYNCLCMDQPLFETFPGFTFNNCSEHFYADEINIIKFHTI